MSERQSLLLKRQAVTLAAKQQAAQQLLECVRLSKLFVNAQHIAAYSAYGGELDPLPLLQLASAQGKHIYLPILSVQAPQPLSFVAYRPGDPLVANRYNILEPLPSPDKIIQPQALDLVLAPVVGFDLQGNRLGMGAGYYDRTFAFLKTLKRPSKPYLLGIAYEWQQLEKIVPASWDVPLDGIATEQHFYHISPE